jgi:hypothetical protein
MKSRVLVTLALPVRWLAVLGSAMHVIYARVIARACAAEWLRVAGRLPEGVAA